jgi:hypothetical protein
VSTIDCFRATVVVCRAPRFVGAVLLVPPAEQPQWAWGKVVDPWTTMESEDVDFPVKGGDVDFQVKGEDVDFQVKGENCTQRTRHWADQQTALFPGGS